jgi:hypothetical protein
MALLLSIPVEVMPGGGEDVLLEEVGVGLAGDFFEEVAEKDVAGVVVEELAAGLEVEGLVAEAGDELGWIGVLPLGGTVVGEGSEAGNAGGVGEEVIDGNVLPGQRGVGKVFADRVFDVELPVLMAMALSCLIGVLAPLLVITATLAFGWRLALASLWIELTVEPTPVGSWNIVTLPTSENNVKLRHSLGYEDDAAIACLVSFIKEAAASA